MLREGQLSANMQVDDETFVNWGASLGEGSAQGSVAAPSQSRLDPIDLLLRGRSASCSQTPRGRKNSPHTVSRHGQSPTLRQKAIGEHIATVTKNDTKCAVLQTPTAGNHS